MINKVLNYISKNNMIDKGEGIVLGVSGGADSVCLLTALNELKEPLNLKLYVVHVNHGIRGAEADSDEKYVEGLCGSMNVWFRAYHYDVPHLAEKNGLSEEEMGRNIRYGLFEKVRKEVGAAKIAVAHNSNDSAETILYNMCRGTGIKGVCGIPPVRGNIIRPLLCCSRSEIEEYIDIRNISYKTDSTNLKSEYTRNKIRLELIPYINENINNRSVEHILNLAEQLSSIEKYINYEAEKAYIQSVKELENEIRIDINSINRYPDIIRQEVIRKCIEKTAGKLKDITSGHINSVVELIDNTTGKRFNLPYDIVCENIYGYCRIKRGKSVDTHFEPIEVSVPGEYIMENGSKFIFSLENSVNFKEKMYTKWFDYDRIKNAMQIRFRQNGDFLEVANGGHKKLKSYFIDEKVPREQRDCIPLLSDGNHIIWIVGYRISEAYKITDSTKNVLKVKYIERNGNNNGRCDSGID